MNQTVKNNSRNWLRPKQILIIQAAAILSLALSSRVYADTSNFVRWLIPIQVRANYQHLEGYGFFPKHLFIDEVSRRDLSAIELSYQKSLLRVFSLNMFSKTAAQAKFSIGSGGRLFQRRSKNEFTSTRSFMLVSFIFPDLYVRSISEIQESSTNPNSYATVIKNNNQIVLLAQYSSMRVYYQRFEVGFTSKVEGQDYHTMDFGYFQTSITKPMVLPDADSVLYLGKIDIKGFLFRYYFGPKWFTFSVVLGWGWTKIMLTNDLRLEYIDKEGKKSRYFSEVEFDFSLGLDFYLFKYIRICPRTGWLAHSINTANEAKPVIDESISYWYTDVSLTIQFSGNE